MLSLFDLMQQLTDKGFIYFFIDEITEMSDFVGYSAFLYNDFTNAGYKVVLAGTYSLGLYLSSFDSLFDRVSFIETSYISFKEQNYLIGMTLDRYLHDGGVLINRSSSVGYSDMHKYVNTSIVRNITRSLRYADVSQYSHLRVLYDNDSVVSLVSRIIESNAGNIVLDTLIKPLAKLNRHIKITDTSK